MPNGSKAGTSRGSKPTADGPDDDDPGTLRRGLTARQRREAREEALLVAALELFGTRGYANTSVRDVCQLAYVSSRDFYASFANREELLRRLAERIDARSSEAFQRGLQSTRKRTGKGKVLAGLHAAISDMATDPRVLRIAYVETIAVANTHTDVGLDALKRSAAWLAETMADGFAKAKIDPARAEALCFAILGAITEMLAYEVHTSEINDADKIADYVIDTIGLMLPIT